MNALDLAKEILLAIKANGDGTLAEITPDIEIEMLALEVLRQNDLLNQYASAALQMDAIMQRQRDGLREAIDCLKCYADLFTWFRIKADVEAGVHSNGLHNMYGTRAKQWMERFGESKYTPCSIIVNPEKLLSEHEKDIAIQNAARLMQQYAPYSPGFDEWLEKYGEK